MNWPLVKLVCKIVLVFCASGASICCENTKNNESSTNKDASYESLVKYAKGFDIQVFKDYKKLIIKSPYPDAKEFQEFILVSDTKLPQKSFTDQNPIIIPLKKIVATSTTHIPMMELLEEETSLIGFPHTDYISSIKTRELIAKNHVKEVGSEQDFNTEILIELQPDALIGFSMGNNSAMYKTIERNGIPVIYNGDWLEETPLGRAEWIKFFGVLFDKDKAADSIFTNIEKNYLKAKQLAKNSIDRPSILTGVLFKDKWNLPAGESFTAQLFKDANTNYLWGGSEGQGSLVLSFESVYEKAQSADFWIGSGYFTTLKELGNANEHYKEFKPFHDKSIYTFAVKRGVTGGVLYFELAAVQPHIVLQDLIKVTHPELLKDYQPFFLSKIE